MVGLQPIGDLRQAGNQHRVFLNWEEQIWLKFAAEIRQANFEQFGKCFFFKKNTGSGLRTWGTPEGGKGKYKSPNVRPR
jgi:hypothetical protein